MTNLFEVSVSFNFQKMAPRRQAPLWYYLYFPFEFIMGSLKLKYNIWQKNKSPEKYEPTVEENVRGKVVVITGASSGLGKATAIEMGKRGAIVIMGCRNLKKAEMARKDIVIKSQSNTVELHHLDLNDFSTVCSFAKDIIEKHPVIDILVNNGGIALNCKKQPLTKEGWDLHMTTNHLGHFLLTNLLIDAILKSTISRVVTVSSTAATVSHLDVNDIMSENTNKLGLLRLNSYENSKLANALFTKSLAKRYPEVTAVTIAPGLVRTPIFQNFERYPLDWIGKAVAMKVVGLDTEDAAKLIVNLCLEKNLKKDFGGFFRFGKRVKAVENMLKDDVAEKLWNASKVYVENI